VSRIDAGVAEQFCLFPMGASRQDVIHTKVFQKYIGDNVAAWFDWSKNSGLPIKRMEDLVFVYGCTLVPSWAAAAFDDSTGNAQLSLASRTLNNGGAGFTWSNIRGTVEYHDSQLNPVCSLLVALTHSALTSLLCPPKKDFPYLSQNRCVFIKCLRARRVLFWFDVHSDGAPFIPPPITLSDDEASHDASCHDEAPHDAHSDDEASHNASSRDEAPHDPHSDDEASHKASSRDEAPHDALSHDEALRDADEAFGYSDDPVSSSSPCAG
jgi:hypothetical protein